MSRFERTLLRMLRAPTYPITVADVEDLTAHVRRARRPAEVGGGAR